MTATALWKYSADQAHWKIQQIPLDNTVKTLDDISKQLPGGAYTTFRTYDRSKALALKKHFDRLEETTRLAGKPLPIQRAALQAALHDILGRLPEMDIRFRITIDLEKVTGETYISTEPLLAPHPEDFEHGVSALTHQLERNNPKAKMTRQLEIAAQIRGQVTDQQINEILTLSKNGVMLEGLSSNFFAIKDQTIWTAEDGVLSGTIRNIALDLALSAGFPVIRQGIFHKDLPHIDEAFITSTSRSILPVVTVDHQPVGDGKPGPVTRRLMQDFQQYLAEHLETV